MNQIFIRTDKISIWCYKFKRKEYTTMYANCFDMDNREIIKIILNAGDILTIGEGGLKQIKYHNPSGEGDKHYCDCYYEDGNVIRVFDVVHMYCSVEIKVEDKYKDLQCPL